MFRVVQLAKASAFRSASISAICHPLLVSLGRLDSKPPAEIEHLGVERRAHHLCSPMESVPSPEMKR